MNVAAIRDAVLKVFAEFLQVDLADVRLDVPIGEILVERALVHCVLRALTVLGLHIPRPENDREFTNLCCFTVGGLCNYIALLK